MPPARRFAILTCMDARLDPAKFAGLAEGDAHVIRNAGGRASDDAIRSLVISHKLLGTNEWFVIHHTDCGMETFTDEIMRGLLRQSLDTAQIGPGGWKDVGKGPGSAEGDFIDWLTIKDQAESVTADVKRIRSHKLVPRRRADLRLYLRREVRPADRGAGGERGWKVSSRARSTRKCLSLRIRSFIGWKSWKELPASWPKPSATATSKVAANQRLCTPR